VDKARILVVEDQYIVAQDLAASLSGLGYEVIATVDTGPKAIEKAGRLRPDLVLMDIVLKGRMDGIEASGQINERWRIPVIFLTAFADRTLLERAKITEPYAYLLKPYSTRELHSAIEVGLNKARMERELRRSRLRFKETVDLLPTGIVETDRTGKVTFINAAGLSLLGLPPGSEAGDVDLRPFINLTSTDKKESCFSKALSGRVSGPAQQRMLRADGTEAVILTNWGPVTVDGQVVGCRASLMDVTELTRLQKRVRDARRMETIATLAGGVAHEFNNALTAIITGIELLQMDPLSGGPSGKYLVNMKDSADRMARQVRQLVAFARSGKYHTISVRLDDFIKSTLPYLAPSIDPGIRVKTHFQNSCPIVSIDENQFRMVLSALVANACEAIKEKGTIEVRAGESVFEPDSPGLPGGLSPGRYATLVVADNGSGMTDDVRSRIFDPFFTTKFYGRGLGMASTYGIVHNHCGWIGVVSSPGQPVGPCSIPANQSAPTVYLRTSRPLQYTCEPVGPYSIPANQSAPAVYLRTSRPLQYTCEPVGPYSIPANQSVPAVKLRSRV